ncbi:hypothetical protein QTO34_001363 [Cnephaeus nilssonii]|uniref:Uncharacterized protein n=1 Tax=Cnephaeus nilssonii TaxID=3371016 RepID=A0AA40LNI8_CNENI|nr:hypothetical protein QTO34_001363 [Eptesicus nilssonii]
MKLQNQQDGPIFIQNIKKPDRDDWENGGNAMGLLAVLEKAGQQLPAAPSFQIGQDPQLCELPGKPLPGRGSETHQEDGGYLTHLHRLASPQDGRDGGSSTRVTLLTSCGHFLLSKQINEYYDPGAQNSGNFLTIRSKHQMSADGRQSGAQTLEPEALWQVPGNALLLHFSHHTTTLVPGKPQLLSQTRAVTRP